MLHEKRLMHMVVLMCLTVAASFAWETWPTEYDMIAHGGEFFAIAISTLAGSRCAFDTSCNDCAAFVSVHQIFYVAFIVYTLVRVQVAQLLCYCVLYVSSTTVVYGIVEDVVCPAVTTTQTSLTRTSTTSALESAAAAGTVAVAEDAWRRVSLSAGRLARAGCQAGWLDDRDVNARVGEAVDANAAWRAAAGVLAEAARARRRRATRWQLMPCRSRERGGAGVRRLLQGVGSRRRLDGFYG